MKKIMISAATLLVLAASAFAFKGSNDCPGSGDCSSCPTASCCVK